MSFLRRGKKTADAQHAAEKGTSDPVHSLADDCMDALAAVLRAWGDHPIELPDRSIAETQEECEGWARHVLLATAPPGDARTLPDGARDWVGLGHAFRKLRQGEHAHVAASLAELRQVVWVCIQALSRASVADTRSDSKVADRLQTLRSAVQNPDVEQLRREAVTFVNVLESEIESRRARQQSQFDRLSANLNNMAAALVSERRKGELDALTQVYGRAAMDEHLASLCEMAQVVKPSAIALMIDVDHFKWVNDRFGHGVGDEILSSVASCLLEQFRRGGDFVARYGGDEFVAISEGGTLDAAVQLGERVLFGVRGIEASHDGEAVRVGVSIGIAALLPSESPREWLDRADKALYASKNAGRDRVTVAERM